MAEAIINYRFGFKFRPKKRNVHENVNVLDTYIGIILIVVMGSAFRIYQFFINIVMFNLK